MKYTVIWLMSAEFELGEIRQKSQDRDQVARAATEINARLREAPHSAGESRGDDTRILFVAPLGILFDILDGHVVRVLKVWRFQSKT